MFVVTQKEKKEENRNENKVLLAFIERKRSKFGKERESVMRERRMKKVEVKYFRTHIEALAQIRTKREENRRKKRREREKEKGKRKEEEQKRKTKQNNKNQK